MQNNDIYNLRRFIAAQESCYITALTEIKRGRKESHWMWYVFPQMKGLGRSPMSEKYGITCLDEAQAYLFNDVLSPRLFEICGCLLNLPTDDVVSIFGRPDNLKLKSSMTLFAMAEPQADNFDRVLMKYFRGDTCKRTLSLLSKMKQ